MPAAELIKEVAKDLKQRVKAPEWTRFVKTGSHVERAPNNPAWFFVGMHRYFTGFTAKGRLVLEV